MSLVNLDLFCSVLKEIAGIAVIRKEYQKFNYMLKVGS